MTTYTATRGAAGVPVAGHGFSGNKKIAWGTIQVSVMPGAGDVFEMCRIPRGAIVTGGQFYGDPLVTAGTSSAPDIDVGFASDTDAFGNFGVLVHAAVSGYKPEAGYMYPFGGLLIQSGPQTMDTEKTVQLTVVTSAASASFTTADLSVVVEYYLP